MKVGCFALVDPFSTLDHQLSRIAALGFKYADVTDNHPGGQLGREFGFSATASLDDNPADLRGMFEQHGLTATSVCAHANLLDPSAPSRYGNSEVSKAVKLAAGMGLRRRRNGGVNPGWEGPSRKLIKGGSTWSSPPPWARERMLSLS